MLTYLTWCLLYMWFLFWFLLKGEPGDRGEQGLKGERGSEVSWNHLRQFETYCWREKTGAQGVAVHCNLNDHSFFQSKNHHRPLNRVFVNICDKTSLLINSCVSTAIQSSLYQQTTLALRKLPRVVPNSLSFLGVSDRNTD